MLNVQMFKGKVVERGLTLGAVANAINIDRSTMSRKLSNNGDEFTIKQVDDLVKLLSLSSEEAMAIFFSQFVA